jgi:PleD family two-component response regulator
LREKVMTIDMSAGFGDGRTITASLGVTTSSPGVDTPSTMLQRADSALYAAKRGGRNCVKAEPAPVTALSERLADREVG